MLLEETEGDDFLMLHPGLMESGLNPRADKMQCNHQYPCNHCTRRRRPELCTYGRLELQAGSDEMRSASIETPGTAAREDEPVLAISSENNYIETGSLLEKDQPNSTWEASLPSCFGYFDGSSSNLLGLMSKV
jgi:hypothetical protein